MARLSDPRRTSTIRQPATTRGCMRRSVHKATANSNIRRLRLCEPARSTRKRWTSGTSHLAVVNSRYAHGLQEPFSAQPKAMSRLARKIRSRLLETSISLILSVTSGAPANRVRFCLDVLRAYQSLVSNSCRSVNSENQPRLLSGLIQVARKKPCANL
jgi:hypothetical protein